MMKIEDEEEDEYDDDGDGDDGDELVMKSDRVNDFHWYVYLGDPTLLAFSICDTQENKTNSSRLPCG